MIIRLAETKDVKSIIAIGQKVLLDFSFKEEDLNKYVSDPAHLVYVADDKKIVGFISIRIAGEDAEIDAIAINSDRQHQGIGTQLLLEAIKDLVDKNVINLLLDVRRKNMQAFRFYKKK